MMGLLSGAWMGVASTKFLGRLVPDPWMYPWIGRTGPGLWMAKRGWNRAPGLFQVRQQRLKSSDLALGAHMGVSSITSLVRLDWSLYMVVGAEQSVEPFWDLLRGRCGCCCLVPVQVGLLTDCGLEGLELSRRPFQDVWRYRWSISH